MVFYYQKSKFWYSLAMTNCSILKTLLLNSMGFHWNLMECYHLLMFVSNASALTKSLIKAYLAHFFA